MANIIYTVFNGDEILKINTEDISLENIYDRKCNQRINGSLIMIREAGIFYNSKKEAESVSEGDVIFVNYDGATVIKDPNLTSIIEKELKKLRDRDANNSCKCEEAVPSATLLTV